MSTALSICMHWRLSPKYAPLDILLMGTLWAFKIKFTADGKFEKLNPRWCVVGTNMDRDIYESFSDVVCWTTVLILAAIRACYPVLDFQFDVSNAFQATRTDDDPSDSPKPLYCANGRKKAS